MSADRGQADGLSSDQFVVGFGKSGALGVFTAAEAMTLRRGQAVLVRTSRGVEIGAVRCPATVHQARLLAAGDLLRCVTAADEAVQTDHAELGGRIFATARAWAERDGLALEILDVEILFDGGQATLQFVGPDAETEPLVHALEEQFSLTVRLENLAAPADHHEHGRCDKPDCGRDASGGCTTCGTGGGCSTCGSGRTDLAEYFSHLRARMPTGQRIPLT
jgi:hypothetical protein